jgi:hypothetical protein
MHRQGGSAYAVITQYHKLAGLFLIGHIDLLSSLQWSIETYDKTVVWLGESECKRRWYVVQKSSSSSVAFNSPEMRLTHEC